MAVIDANIVSGKDGKIWVDRYDLSGYGNSIQPSFKAVSLEAVMFGRWQHKKVGAKGGSLNIEAVYDVGLVDIRAISETLHGTEANKFIAAVGKPVADALDYLQVGSPAVAGLVNCASRGVSAKTNEITAASWELELSDAFCHNAIILWHTSRSTSGNSDYYDATRVSTTKTGYAYLSARLVSGAAAQTLDLVIQDSPNHVDWTTRITFTQLVQGTVTNYAQRLTKTNGLARYWRVLATAAGSPAATWDYVVAYGEP